MAESLSKKEQADDISDGNRVSVVQSRKHEKYTGGGSGYYTEDEEDSKTVLIGQNMSKKNPNFLFLKFECKPRAPGSRDKAAQLVINKFELLSKPEGVELLLFRKGHFSAKFANRLFQTLPTTALKSFLKEYYGARTVCLQFEASELEYCMRDLWKNFLRRTFDMTVDILAVKEYATLLLTIYSSFDGDRADELCGCIANPRRSLFLDFSKFKDFHAGRYMAKLYSEFQLAKPKLKMLRLVSKRWADGHVSLLQTMKNVSKFVEEAHLYLQEWTPNFVMQLELNEYKFYGYLRYHSCSYKVYTKVVDGRRSSISFAAWQQSTAEDYGNEDW
uniref:Uncharacterized protein n=1 Tax=Panagrolaimus sp. JU765 TaxID=591449 RepID=A0AC34RFC1_9BILA